jgi:hypothetical protein
LNSLYKSLKSVHEAVVRRLLEGNASVDAKMKVSLVESEWAVGWYGAAYMHGAWWALSWLVTGIGGAGMHG